MDVRWTADLATLCRLHKPLKALISCKGQDGSYSVYQHALTNYFTLTPLNWKRTDRSSLHVTLPICFVPFDETLFWGSHVTPPNLAAPAFLHIFFINCASVDEYRSSIRHNVSEWFAKVSAKSELQWLIVFDTTRAKERKARQALTDKIRGDFSKHLTHVVEVGDGVDSPSFGVLTQAIQSHLFTHLEIVCGAWETVLESLKERSHDPHWNLFHYAATVIEYSRWYWSCGCLDQALSLLDDLDRFLIKSFVDFVPMKEEDRPKWLSVVRRAEVAFCPSLSSSFRQPTLDLNRDYNFLALRHFLLSQQLLISLYLYQSRMRSRGAAPSIRVDFAVLVLKYAHHAVQELTDKNNLLNLGISPYRLACWTLMIVSETIQLCGLLAEPSSVDAAATSLCALHVMKFEALLQLDTVPTSDAPETRKTLIDWLKRSEFSDVDSMVELIESGSNVWLTAVQKAHDVASSTLTQNGRVRQATSLGKRLATALRMHDRADQALPYELRFVDRLLKDGLRDDHVIAEVDRILSCFKPEHDRCRFLSYCAMVVLHSSNEKMQEEKLRMIENAFKNLQQHSMLLSDLMFLPTDLFKIRVVDFTSEAQVPAANVSIKICVDNAFPSDLHDVDISVSWMELDETVMSRRRKPAFLINHSSRDGACRMLVPHRGIPLDRTIPSSPHATRLMATTTVACLRPGVNEVLLQLVSEERGCFVVEHVDVCLFLSRLTTTITEIESQRPPIVFIKSPPNKLWLADIKTDLVAGVVQEIELFAEAGSAVSESTINVLNSEIMEFQNSSHDWCSSMEVAIPSLTASERTSLRLRLVRPMDQELTSSSAVRKSKLSLQWLGRVWVIELPFVSLVVMSSKTSLLTNNVLWELTISRVLEQEWVVRVVSATLEVPQNEKDDPPTLAKMLNEDIEDLVPNSVTALVWILPQSSPLKPLRHRLSIKYHVFHKSSSASLTNREFIYSEDVELVVPKVAYELCTQILSQQPGAQLCRAGAPCDLVVSLRSLNYTVEMLYIILDADAKLWTLNERAKVLQVKESGLGQMAFSVVPCAAGFLPYPSVAVYSCLQLGQRSSSDIEGHDLVPGTVQVSFQRSSGKQIRVLAPSQQHDKGEHGKHGFREKLVKLFD